MKFSVVTPSFGQLAWLELCIASVADQQVTARIEHPVCDGGSEGIEEFAREVGARFYRAGDRGQETVDSRQPGGVSEDLHGPRGDSAFQRGALTGRRDEESSRYSLTIYS